MGPGTFYGSIQRMLPSALIEEAPRTQRASRGDDDDARRRYYRTTTFGKRVLALELERLSARRSARATEAPRRRRATRMTTHRSWSERRLPRRAADFSA